mmetsp:Transcript_7903/g.26059  ORF Transcript_7903/g.26059 Transcript_7903/m.26059 type:complete len:282 (-) Transcript_7903:102-947(-)
MSYRSARREELDSPIVGAGQHLEPARVARHRRDGAARGRDACLQPRLHQVPDVERAVLGAREDQRVVVRQACPQLELTVRVAAVPVEQRPVGAVEQPQRAVEAAGQGAVAVSGQGHVRQRCAERVGRARARTSVVRPQHAVHRRSQDLGAADGHRAERIGGPLENLHRGRVARAHVPAARRRVVRRRDEQRRALAGIGDRVDPLRMARQAPQHAAGRDVPHKDGAVAPTRGEAAVVVRHRQPQHALVMPRVRLDRLCRLFAPRVPQQDAAVVAAREAVVAV